MIIHEVEQRSPEWHSLRAGIPTASGFDNLLTPTGKLSTSIHAYAVTLANELFLGEAEPDGFTGNAWTDRGEALEEDAVNRYIWEAELKVSPIGFVTDDAKEMGCSPDGIIEPDGMLEIKCLKAVNHTLALQEYAKSKESPKKYNAQTQGQLMICGREWCDLFFYHENLPPLIIRQYPDEKLQSLLAEQLKSVCNERDEVLKILRKENE